MAISQTQFSSSSPRSTRSSFNAPADSMGSSMAAKSGRDSGASTIGSMGNPMAMRTGNISGFGGGGVGAAFKR